MVNSRIPTLNWGNAFNVRTTNAIGMHRFDVGCYEPIEVAATAKPAEPEVGTFTVRPQSRALVRELPGRIAPTRVSDVRARVSGIVVERLFQQGTEVTAGDPLYRI